MLTNEECGTAIDLGDFYRVPIDKRGLNYAKFFSEGKAEQIQLKEFNSNNTELMTVEQVKEKLLTLDFIQDELANWRNRK